MLCSYLAAWRSAESRAAKRLRLLIVGGILMRCFILGSCAIGIAATAFIPSSVFPHWLDVLMAALWGGVIVAWVRA